MLIWPSNQNKRDSDRRKNKNKTKADEMSIVWSPGVTKALLEKIKHREVLWDTNHRFFNKKNLKRSCFDQICMELKSENKHLHTLTTGEFLVFIFMSMRINWLIHFEL